jgi:hypothetical protein
MHRSYSFEHVLRSIPRLSERVSSKVHVAVRRQGDSKEGPVESASVPAEADRYFLGEMATDALDAVRAATATAKRFNQPVVIQDDLSVVFKSKATRRILETFYP